MTSDSWNPSLYDHRHAFVHERAGGVFELLDPRPGERVLDAGCGTGHLTQKIAERGARVVGIDASPAMISEARRLFPTLDLVVMDIREMTFGTPFDAVFSNAALHWVRPPERAAARIREALRPGGRLAAELGARGNIERVLAAAQEAGRRMGREIGPFLFGNYFPSLGEYSTLLECAGFHLQVAEQLDRPTPLEGPQGLRNWVRMFRPGALEQVPEPDREAFFRELEDLARSALLKDGVWHADYRRLRILAVRP